MNYIKQSMAFFDLKLTNEISTGAQTLWHTLFCINNKKRWEKEFKVPNIMLMGYTSLNERNLLRAREELIKLGIIKYKKGSGSTCGTYSLVKLYEDDEEEEKKEAEEKKETAEKEQTADKPAAGNEAKKTEICQRFVSESVGERATLYKQNKRKRNKTKQNKTGKRKCKRKNGGE